MRYRSCSLVVAVLFVLTGCSGSSQEPSTGGGAATTASTSSTDVASAVATATAGATVAPLPVLASAKFSGGDTPLQLDLNEVRATGQVMNVTFTVTSLETDLDATRWQVASFFSRGIDKEGAFTVNGVYVLDAKNALRYLPARTAGGDCVCSNGLAGTFVHPGQSLVLTATFKAPPAEVGDVQVVIPHLPPLTATITR